MVSREADGLPEIDHLIATTIPTTAMPMATITGTAQAIHLTLVFRSPTSLANEVNDFTSPAQRWAVRVAQLFDIFGSQPGLPWREPAYGFATG